MRPMLYMVLRVKTSILVIVSQRILHDDVRNFISSCSRGKKVKDMGRSSHSKMVSDQIRKSMGSSKTEVAVWGFVEAFSAALDGGLSVKELCPVPGSGILLNVIKIAMASGSSDANLFDNPYFIGNGQDGTHSTVTATYLRNRNYKNMGASTSSVIGAVGSVWTTVDVSGIVLHSNASGTTAAHLKVLSDMVEHSRKTGTVAQWLNTIIKIKAIKALARGASLAGASIPIPAAGLATGLVAAALSTGAKLTLTKACTAASLELHWRARQEQFMSGQVTGVTGGSVGPASRIITELFTKRGITKVLGKYNTMAIINEPAGWMAINDKLLLM